MRGREEEREERGGRRGGEEGGKEGRTEGMESTILGERGPRSAADGMVKVEGHLSGIE